MHIRYNRELFHNRFGQIGLCILTLVILAATLAPFLTQFRPSAYTGDIFHPPSAKYWLGTNDVGQDIWSQLVYGARTSLLVAAGAAFLSAALSLLIGGTSAMFGGVYEEFCLRFIDILLVIPPVILMILTAAYLKPNILLLILLLATFVWPSGARIIRAQTLSLKSRMSYAAARTFGANWRYLLLRHILLDLGPILIAIIINNARRAIFMEAGLSFLGVSDPALISWGKMIQQALPFIYLDVWQWCLLPAGLAVSLTITGLVFTGYTFETVFNPRLRMEKR
ncbi:MAG TPA: ABC transporter permease [Methylomusa anaerophila]|uniref:Oligopeptide transport system permease protein OppC n=1 Tax=Methylomusa anaerophila TaxID=1930071 RepID=A0A348AEZ5_9FIRM|nr:ABC transporter permease [Methylomusa anaerophila]BBB89643.1 oligopeptide transport system permease protein OppC [Methylomusa anaerophila]HML89581.1 ABC transporter permease [Methylomusa anaerophila]